MSAGLTALGGFVFGPVGAIIGAALSLLSNIGVSIYQNSADYKNLKNDFNTFWTQTWNDVVTLWNYLWSFDWI